MEIAVRPKMVWTPNLYRVPTVSRITFLLSGSHIFKGFPLLPPSGYHCKWQVRLSLSSYEISFHARTSTP